MKKLVSSENFVELEFGVFYSVRMHTKSDCFPQSVSSRQELSPDWIGLTFGASFSFINQGSAYSLASTKWQHQFFDDDGCRGWIFSYQNCGCHSSSICLFNEIHCEIYQWVYINKLHQLLCPLKMTLNINRECVFEKILRQKTINMPLV